MSDYIGEKCLICNKPFKVGDDIVVCPECGTPYHRECYNKEGKCVNEVLHTTHQSWKATHDKNSSDDSTENTIKCPVCGEENSSDTIFCKKCGNPLGINKSGDNASFDGQIPPFISQMMNATTENKFTPESDIDGVKLKEYSTYVGSNPLYYMTNFIRFGKYNRKVSVNLTAFLFPEYYFIYRKMYLIGILVYILRYIIAIPLFIGFAKNGVFDGSILKGVFVNLVSENTLDWMLSLTQFLSTALLFACSLSANYLYYRKARKDIMYIHDATSDEAQRSERIAKKGGASFKSCFIAIIIPILIAMAILLIDTIK